MSRRPPNRKNSRNNSRNNSRKKKRPYRATPAAVSVTPGGAISTCEALLQNAPLGELDRILDIVKGLIDQRQAVARRDLVAQQQAMARLATSGREPYNLGPDDGGSPQYRVYIPKPP